MTHNQFLGLRLQQSMIAAQNKRLRARGWRPLIVPFTGYGCPDHVRVLGRVVLTPNKQRTMLGVYAEQFLNQRGWRNFVELPVPNHLVRVTAGGKNLDIATDHSGYFDVQVSANNLSAGWHAVDIWAEDAEPVKAPVQVVSVDQDFGLISDIDDTIISTSLPRLFLAAWNSFVMTEGNRQAIEGMARMYQQLLASHPGAPIIYISTGSWATLPFLNRFMKRHGFPKGPILLTDFGPTQNAWFRNGKDHKRYSIFEVARDFPNIKWVLVGDDGQHDPVLYREFSELSPDHVRAIAIRELTSTEQILAHGSTRVLADSANIHWRAPTVAEVSGANGDVLHEKLKAVLERR